MLRVHDRVDSMGQLRRALGVRDAATLGVASMVGAGLFSAFAPAARSAGTGLLAALAVAAVVAVCNAASSVQLAVQDPRAGGAYAWGRRHLGHWPGFIAGWCFVVGKTGSCAAVALTISIYAVPAPLVRPAAIAALVLVTTINCLGVQRTATAARVLLVPVLIVLGAAVVIGLALPPVFVPDVNVATSPFGVLQASGLLFFAFAGYARVTTLAEEVRDPARTLPIGVALAILIALIIYGVGALALLHVLGPARLAATAAPWGQLATTAAPWLAVPLRVAAVAAAAGSLLALLAGVSRTALAMAREHDLPSGLAAVQTRFGTPVRAEVAVAAAAALLVLIGDLRLMIGISSFAVLVYYLVANTAALRQQATARLMPRAVPVLGGIGCIVLAATLPWQSIATTATVIAIGCGYRTIRIRLRAKVSPQR